MQSKKHIYQHNVHILKWIHLLQFLLLKKPDKLCKVYIFEN